MRQILLLPLAALLAMPVFSQTPADTTLTIRNIEIQGTRFAGLSERGGMKILRVDNNLSSVTNTAADAFRQLPSVITDMEFSGMQIQYRSCVISLIPSRPKRNI